MQPQALEPICHHGVCRLGTVASIPVGFPKPIAELRMGVLLVDLKANGTQEGVVHTPNNGEVDEFTAPAARQASLPLIEPGPFSAFPNGPAGSRPLPGERGVAPERHETQFATHHSARPITDSRVARPDSP
jgi:hypothetical protein